MGMAGIEKDERRTLLPRYSNGASRRPPEAQPYDSDCLQSVCAIAAVVTAGGLILALIVYLAVTSKDPPQFSVAIASVSGIEFFPDPAQAQQPAALNPEFNVTVRVTSRSTDEACLDPATSVQVSYLRVTLAGGHVHPGHCAPPMKNKDETIFARGRAVAVPGFMLDSLVEDVRTGEAVFEVTLMRPHGLYWEMLTCWAKIANSASLDVPCRSSWVSADLPAPKPADNRLRRAGGALTSSS